MPHHREGIQEQLDKAYDEGHRDNEAMKEAKAKIAEIKGKTGETEREFVSSPEQAEALSRLRDAGYLDTSFEGKEVHELIMRALPKDEALAEYMASGGKTWVWDELEKNMPYTTPEAKTLDVMMVNFNKAIGSDEAIAEMDALGVRPLTYEELIQYGIAHPSHQEKKILVGLGSKHTLVGSPLAPSLGVSDDGGRELFASRSGRCWGVGSAFPGVRK